MHCQHVFRCRSYIFGIKHVQGFRIDYIICQHSFAGEITELHSLVSATRKLQFAKTPSRSIRDHCALDCVFVLFYCQPILPDCITWNRDVTMDCVSGRSAPLRKPFVAACERSLHAKIQEFREIQRCYSVDMSWAHMPHVIRPVALCYFKAKPVVTCLISQNTLRQPPQSPSSAMEGRIVY